MQLTSLEAYGDISPILGERQQTVYNIICSNPGVSNHDISRILHWEINNVTPRVKELRDMFLILNDGDKIDRVTGKRVLKWKKLE